MCFFPPLENITFRKLPFFPLKVHSLYLLHPQHLVAFIFFFTDSVFQKNSKNNQKGKLISHFLFDFKTVPKEVLNS